MAAVSPIRVGPAFSDAADADELRFREEIEPYPDPERDIPAWLERKELVAKLEYALGRAGVRPAGTVVELGAGVCWLSSALACRPEVTRVVGTPGPASWARAPVPRYRAPRSSVSYR